VTVLIKGSRVNRLERVVQALTGGGLIACCCISPNISRKYYSGFHVFQYLTLRGILAAMTALAIALFIGSDHDRACSRRYQIGQQVRTDGPQSHLAEIRHAHHGRRPDLGGLGEARCCGRILSSRFVWMLIGATTLGFGLPSASTTII
jgi:phospho-N-acetylmuramoyl-pentapeptide-transferase